MKMIWLHMQFVLIFITAKSRPSTMAAVPAEVFADTFPRWLQGTESYLNLVI